jgi:hypothetical protein
MGAGDGMTSKVTLAVLAPDCTVDGKTPKRAEEEEEDKLPPGKAVHSMILLQVRGRKTSALNRL